MNEKDNIPGEFLEFDLRHVLQVLMRKAWVVALVSVLCAALAYGGAKLFITPTYESSAMFYVNNSASSVGGSSSISSADISASKSLVNLYLVILDTPETMLKIAEEAGVSYGYSDLEEMIHAESVNNTELFQVIVTSPDPLEAEALARAASDVLPARISEIIEGTSAKKVQAATIPMEPSFPNYLLCGILGFLLGFVLSAGFIVLRTIFDTIVRSEDDISRLCSYPILASVPDMTAPSKPGYGQTAVKKTASPAIIGKDISFSASEAYRLLRTKLQYSFADEKPCRIIGISSAMTGEGKSVTSSNLAWILSQLNHKVLLIDCDMHRPTLAAKLKLKKAPGLSGVLTGQHRLRDVIQGCGIQGNEQAFHVIASGENPPNPVELLSSARMSKLLTALSGHYDYVLLDLPPVSEVTDALAVTKNTDGILLVVRENHCNRRLLSDTIRQFEFVNARILGITYNGTAEDRGAFSKYYSSASRTGSSSAPKNSLEIPDVKV